MKCNTSRVVGFGVWWHTHVTYVNTVRVQWLLKVKLYRHTRTQFRIAQLRNTRPLVICGAALRYATQPTTRLFVNAPLRTPPHGTLAVLTYVHQ